MSREENVTIFEDTKKACKTNKMLIEAVENSTKNQELILEGDAYSVDETKRYEDKSQIVISKKDPLRLRQDTRE